MARQSYYIVQCDRRCYVRNDWRGGTGAVLCTHEPDKALRCARYGEALAAWRTVCAEFGRREPSRFPRIVKVTIETKTVKDRK